MAFKIILLMKSLILLLALHSLVMCNSYNKEKEPYVVPGLDHGLIQSPINIVTRDVALAEHHIEAKYLPTHEEIQHKEHTVEMEYDSGSYVVFDDTRYSCKQFHFHTPSEHLIDGVTYPMELHLVHTNADNMAKTNHYFVLSVLFKMGEENAFLANLMKDIPDEIGATVEHEDIYYNISDLIANDMSDYYHYVGSLTTAPYTETVEWAVLEHILEASPEQIARMNKIEGNNARHIQSVNGRRIEIVHE